MNVPKLTDLVGNGKKVTFVRFRKGEMIYTTECGFEFPVPVENSGDAVFYATDSAGLYMRYMRKQITLIKQEIDQLAQCVNVVNV